MNKTTPTLDFIEKHLVLLVFLFVLSIFGLLLLRDYRIEHPKEEFPVFLMPIKGAKIPQGAGYLPNAPRPYRNGIHECIDLEAKEGTPVEAARDGRVVKVINEALTLPEPYSQEVIDAAAQMAKAGEFERVRDIIEGRMIEIEHRFKRKTWKTRYCHLGAIMVEEGMKVKRGQTIAGVGNTGYSLEPHLCFTIVKPDGEFLGKGYDDLELQLLLNEYIKDVSYFKK